jgi:hypothetical protein
MDWPGLALDRWQATYATLHRCLQIIGKVQLALTPHVNHYWNVAFRLTACGFATPPLPHRGGTFTVDMDFVDHAVIVRSSTGARRSLGFVSRPVADFYRDLMTLLGSLDIQLSIWDHPVELQSEAIPFHIDREHRSYDPDAVERWWSVVAQSALVLEQFRSRFIGKCSPVHFFWGSFDLSVSRFSGRRAPPRAGADRIERDAFSHEVSSVGFWPGDRRQPAPAYFSYFAPTPPGLEDAAVEPEAAYWHRELNELILPYEAVRAAASPDRTLLAFCQSSYEAGARLADWNRAELERG